MLSDHFQKKKRVMNTLVSKGYRDAGDLLATNMTRPSQRVINQMYF